MTSGTGLLAQVLGATELGGDAGAGGGKTGKRDSRAGPCAGDPAGEGPTLPRPWALGGSSVPPVGEGCRPQLPRTLEPAACVPDDSAFAGSSDHESLPAQVWPVL